MCCEELDYIRVVQLSHDKNLPPKNFELCDFLLLNPLDSNMNALSREKRGKGKKYYMLVSDRVKNKFE